jgi:hypothetical protein
MPQVINVDDLLHFQLRQHRQKHQVHDLLLLAQQVGEGHALE